MLTTVEAEIEVGGKIRLLEPVEIHRTTKAIVTLLEENGNGGETGNAAKILEFLRANRLPTDARPGQSVVEARIEEARESWD